MTERPDFVIAGAPKCGTTALFEYLCTHPDVFMPSIKEPKFFCTDLKTKGGVYNSDEYRALFAAAPAQCVTGEASTLYLYSKVAIERLMAHNPRTRVIIMLRNPIDAAHSLHAAGWSHRLESIADFEQAWRAQEARLTGALLPPDWPDPATLQYGPIYRYAEQVRRVLRHVPEAQLHIICYEEFFADPGRHFARLLEFLQGAPARPREFAVVNSAMGARSQRLERWLRAPPGWLQGLYTPLRPLFRAAHLSPAAVLWRFNGTPRPKQLLSPRLRAELTAYFAADVAELEGLLGRPLWRRSELSAYGSLPQDSARRA
jgi:Sulfotransferase domain